MPDWRRKGPTDGTERLHWPAAVAAAQGHVEHALWLLQAERYERGELRAALQACLADAGLQDIDRDDPRLARPLRCWSARQVAPARGAPLFVSSGRLGSCLGVLHGHASDLRP